MKLIRIVPLVVGICTGILQSLSAQVYSLNIVGYANVSIQPGNNLIANQFYTIDYTLNYLIPVAPEGSTFTKWNTATLDYLTPSTYVSGTGWTIDYSLPPTDGGLLTTPTAFTNAFSGEVSANENGPIFIPPPLGDGVFVVSASVPYTGASFQQTIGRDPTEGEWVRRLNPTTQTYFTTRFLDGSWNNGAPALNLGEAAMFGLGTGALVFVPEPGTVTLGIVGAAFSGACLLKRRRRR